MPDSSDAAFADCYPKPPVSNRPRSRRSINSREFALRKAAFPDSPLKAANKQTADIQTSARTISAAHFRIILYRRSGVVFPSMSPYSSADRTGLPRAPRALICPPADRHLRPRRASAAWCCKHGISEDRATDAKRLNPHRIEFAAMLRGIVPRGNTADARSSCTIGSTSARHRPASSIRIVEDHELVPEPDDSDALCRRPLTVKSRRRVAIFVGIDCRPDSLAFNCPSVTPSWPQ